MILHQLLAELCYILLHYKDKYHPWLEISKDMNRISSEHNPDFVTEL